MSKNFFWVVLVFTLTVWAGVAVYYLWPVKQPQISKSPVFVIISPFPSMGLLEKPVEGISPSRAEGWYLYKAKFSLPEGPVGYSIKYPEALVLHQEETSELNNQLFNVVSFTPRDRKEYPSLFKISLYLKSLEGLLSEEEALKAQEIIIDGIRAKKKLEIDREGYEVRKVYIPVPSVDYTFLLQGNVLPPDKVGIDYDKVIDEMIKSFKIEKL